MVRIHHMDLMGLMNLIHREMDTEITGAMATLITITVVVTATRVGISAAFVVAMVVIQVDIQVITMIILVIGVARVIAATSVEVIAAV